jgi:hypothetical protein
MSTSLMEQLEANRTRAEEIVAMLFPTNETLFAPWHYDTVFVYYDETSDVIVVKYRAARNTFFHVPDKTDYGINCHKWTEWEDKHGVAQCLEKALRSFQ